MGGKKVFAKKLDKRFKQTSAKLDPKTFKTIPGKPEPPFDIETYDPHDGRAYPIEYLKSITVDKVFLLDKKRIFIDMPKHTTFAGFASKIGKASVISTRANKLGLVVTEVGKDKKMMLNTSKTWNKMSAYYHMHWKERRAFSKDPKNSAPSVTLAEHGNVAISVEINPKDADLRKMTKSVHPDEMEMLTRRWMQITGKKELPDLERRAVTRVLWNLRALQITNFLLDGKPYATILMHMMNDWDLSHRKSRRMIAMVEKSMVRSLDKSKSLLISKAYLRYERLFSKAMITHDIRAATVINKEIISMFGIDIAAKKMMNIGGTEEDGHLAILKAIEADGRVVADDDSVEGYDE